MKLEIKSYTLNFNFEARTSRGSMADRQIWLMELTHRGRKGVGEVAPIAGLSPENPEDIPDVLDNLKVKLAELAPADVELNDLVDSNAYPSVRFGMETALRQLNHGEPLFDNSFSRGEKALAINGLVWMADKDQMIRQLDEKLEAGFNCIKIKVGAIDFQQELQVLEYLRSKSGDVILRLDANGAFPTNSVLSRLNELSRFNVHSIEQPIAPRQPEAMKLVIQKSPIPIALDEELIGVPENSRRQVLDELKPHFLVLKPSLLGGFLACRDWISAAEEREIDWWITSYLESNVGLNAIAQFTADVDKSDHRIHGLGTGGLYENNFESSLRISRGRLHFG